MQQLQLPFTQVVRPSNLPTPLPTPVLPPEWKWSPEILEQMEHWGIPWEVLDRELTEDELGGSPGDVAWDGEVLLLEASCPPEWVLHEIAHYIVCQKLTPEKLREQNWGLDGFWGLPEAEKEILDALTPSGQSWDDWCEAQACNVNVALLIYLNLPWKKVAEELGSSGDFWPAGAPVVHWDFEERKYHEAWAGVREGILSRARPFLQETYPNLFT